MLNKKQQDFIDAIFGEHNRVENIEPPKRATKRAAAPSRRSLEEASILNGSSINAIRTWEPLCNVPCADGLACGYRCSEDDEVE